MPGQPVRVGFRGAGEILQRTFAVKLWCFGTDCLRNRAIYAKPARILAARVLQPLTNRNQLRLFPLSFSFIKETIQENFVDTIFPLMLPT